MRVPIRALSLKQIKRTSHFLIFSPSLLLQIAHIEPTQKHTHLHAVRILVFILVTRIYPFAICTLSY